MPIFHTASGDISVENWGYMLQGSDGELDPAVLAASSFDLIVTDFSRDGSLANMFTTAEIAAISDGPGGRTVVASYISIGEASEFREHWKPAWTDNGLASGSLTALAPSWLGPINPEWPESRKVRFWDSDWQDEIFNAAGTGWLDHIVAQGFDAAYLDIVEAYYFWGEEVDAADRLPGDPANSQEAAARMVDFIVAMTAHARQTNPDFFVIPQNGAFILDDMGDDAARRSAYLDAVGAIGVEDVYFGGDQDENNAFNPDEERISVLQQDFLDNDIPVFAVDYVNQHALVSAFVQAADDDGFIAFTAPDRDLDQLNLTLAGNGSAQRMQGGAGDDNLDGGGGADLLLGQAGHDTITLGGATLHTAGYVAHNVSSDSQTGTGVRISLEGLVQIEAVTDGGSEIDSIELSGESDAFFLHDAFSGFHGSLTLSADYAGNDSAARFRNIEEIHGLGGDDIIDLTSPDYTLAGVTISIFGGQGNDVIWGSDADETINGGTGNDTLFGGTGADTLEGGAGADTFEFTRTSTDTNVLDFDPSQGDMLRFYNTGGAEFDPSSIALTQSGITINYVDTATAQTHVLDIDLAVSADDFNLQLADIEDAVDII